MIKRTLLITFLACAGFISSHVYAADVVPVRSQKIRYGSEHTPVQRTPIRLPIIYIDARTLMFEDSFIGSEVTILQNGQEVYADTVGVDGNIVLPDCLSGEYELQIVIGDYIITGTFCVE
ncbi:MAG: hypothetical protein Q4F85_00190 [Prevotella sp.]|nr:hypothetical protein [Prevotella sp.]